MLSKPECTISTYRAIDRYTDEPYSQLQTGKASGAEAYNGMVDCFQKIVRNEGYASVNLRLL